MTKTIEFDLELVVGSHARYSVEFAGVFEPHITPGEFLQMLHVAVTEYSVRHFEYEWWWCSERVFISA